MVQPRGRGMRQGMERGQGRGRMGGFAAGPEGFCICPKCKAKVQKQRAKPCTKIPCPECGAMMMRG